MGDTPQTNHPSGRDLDGCMSLHVGRIQSAVPGLNFYTVFCGTSVLTATTASDAGGRVIGVRGGGQLLPGTWVIIAAPKNDLTDGPAIILGAIRTPYDEQNASLADQDVLVPNAGFVWDRIHHYLTLTQPETFDLFNANDGTPLDALGGEWGKYGAMGTAVHIGHFMAFLRASAHCGIWCFTVDELVRVAGRSVEMHTLSRDYQDAPGEGGELCTVDARALVPWEALGVTAPGVPAAEDTDEAQDDPNNPPTKTPVNAEVDQVGIFRDVQMHGWCADISQRFISVPDLDNTAPRRMKNAEADAKATRGVFREVRSADGSYLLQSAKSVMIEKYVAIPVPLRRHDAASPQGDTPHDTKFNADFGEGEVHDREDYLFGGEPTAAGRSTLGLELHAFAAAQQRRNFRDRKDWAYPQESETALAEELGSAVYPDFSLSPNRSWMPLPRFTELDVQKGRWEGVRYYASRSAVELLDDGSVVIGDGYGAQLILSGGNAFLTAPNDVITAPGRNVVQLAPNDMVCRAGNSTDITSSRGDMRFKAERNLQVLAANSGRGGLVIESRAVERAIGAEPGEASDYTGIIFKAENAPICTLSKDLYFHTIPGPGIPDIQGDAGGKVIFRVAGAFQTYAVDMAFGSVEGCTFAAGGGADDPRTDPQDLAVYRLGALSCEIGATRQIPLVLVNTGTMSPTAQSVSGLVINGSMVWSGTGFWDADIQARLTLTFDGGLRSASTEIQSLEAPEIDRLRENLRQVDDGVDVLATVTVSSIRTLFADRSRPYQAEDYLIVSDVVQEQVFFSLRTEQDMRLANDPSFALPQWQWQQYAESAGQGSLWEEPEVAYPPVDGLTMMPWPGKRLWTEAEVFLKTDGKYFQKLSVNDAEVDDQSELERVTLATGYLVNAF